MNRSGFGSLVSRTNFDFFIAKVSAAGAKQASHLLRIVNETKGLWLPAVFVAHQQVTDLQADEKATATLKAEIAANVL